MTFYKSIIRRVKEMATDNLVTISLQFYRIKSKIQQLSLSQSDQ